MSRNSTGSYNFRAIYILQWTYIKVCVSSKISHCCSFNWEGKKWHGWRYLAKRANILWFPDLKSSLIPWTVHYIRDCRKSPNCTFFLFLHLVKSTTYKSWLVAKPKFSGFFDSLYFNLHFSSWDRATILCARFTGSGSVN